MDRVLVRGGQPIAGLVDYVAGLVVTAKPFQIFTNNSRFTPESRRTRVYELDAGRRALFENLREREQNPASPSTTRHRQKAPILSVGIGCSALPLPTYL
ncbi:hypothetical protein [Mesorhizobium sp. M1378]|uniref:hypothetical protein n=1 Tax=Mesorhizobium sp. M1378 TaxID=2957092 RepID=UPI0033378087